MDVVTLDIVTLTHRDRAILRAVAAGTGELTVGVEPDLYLDGRCCCDQPAARRLAHAGLIAAGPGPTGRRVPARLTAAGGRVLAGSPVHVAAALSWAPAAESGTGRDLSFTTQPGSTGATSAGRVSRYDRASAYV